MYTTSVNKRNTRDQITRDITRDIIVFHTDNLYLHLRYYITSSCCKYILLF